MIIQKIERPEERERRQRILGNIENAEAFEKHAGIRNFGIDDKLEEGIREIEINLGWRKLDAGHSRWICKECMQLTNVETEARQERKEFCSECGKQTWHKRADMKIENDAEE